MSRILVVNSLLWLGGCAAASPLYGDHATDGPGGSTPTEGLARPMPNPTSAPTEGLFDSTFRLRVYLIREAPCDLGVPPAIPVGDWLDDSELIGQTPTPDRQGVAIPAGARWYVEPVDPDLSTKVLAALAAELGRKAISGLSLENCTEVDDLAPLQEVQSLRMLKLPADHVEGVDVSRLAKTLSGLEALAIPNAKSIHGSYWGSLKRLPRLASLEIGICWDFSDQDVKWLSELTNLSTLRVSCCEHAIDADLARLAGLSNLTDLLLLNCPRITDAGLQSLANLPRLRSLLLQCQQVTGSCFGVPGSFRNLKGMAFFPTGHCASSSPTDAGLAGVGQVRGLRDLHLSCNTRITDVGMAHLKDLTELETLSVSGCYQITDQGVSYLAELTQLSRLSLAGTKATNQGIQHIVGLTLLRELDLSSARLSQDGLSCVLGMRRLQSLNLGRTDLGPKELGALATLPDLRVLKVAGLTDAGMSGVAALSQLTALEVSECEKISDIGYAHLGKLGGLRELALLDCKQLTDATLVPLSRLTELRRLVLTESAITGSGLRHLKNIHGLDTLVLAGPREGSRLTDLGLLHLAGLRTLSELDLQNCAEITDEGLSKLAGLTWLAELDLRGCRQITDVSVATLAHLRLLSSLGLTGTRITESGRQELRCLLRGLQFRCWIPPGVLGSPCLSPQDRRRDIGSPPASLPPGGPTPRRAARIGDAGQRCEQRVRVRPYSISQK